MRYANLLLALAMTISLATIASADTGPAATGSSPRRSAPARSYQGGYRRGWFSGRSAKNWYLSRGTPDDNSTIPTPINRNPKGRPKNNPVIFPKNM